MNLDSPILNSEQFGHGPNLTFIHGWGAQNSVWREWIEQFFGNHFCITLIELPGCGESPVVEDKIQADQLEQQWIDAITNVMPESTHLVGWSLGGLLAQKIAIQNPNRIISLTNLASTPKFIQANDWHWAVQPSLLNDFILALGKDTATTLTHFWKLQIQGSDGARQLIKLFITKMKQRSLPKALSLAQGLQLLKQMDNRIPLQTLNLPTLWLLGENDPLIPQEFVKEFSTIQPQARVAIISGAAHMPFYSHPEQTANALLDFLSLKTTTNNHKAP